MPCFSAISKINIASLISDIDIFQSKDKVTLNSLYAKTPSISKTWQDSKVVKRKLFSIPKCNYRYNYRLSIECYNNKLTTILASIANAINMS